MFELGMSQRRALAVVRMSASSYRYEPKADRSVELRERILVLAQRYERYGVGMIYLKLRQAGVLVNYKRVERLYQEAKLQVRRRSGRRCRWANGSRCCGQIAPTRSGRWTSCSTGWPMAGCSRR